MTSAQQFARSLGNTVMFGFLAGYLTEKHKDSLPFPVSIGIPSRSVPEPGKSYTRITIHL
jgi:hypothetical protein